MLAAAVLFSIAAAAAQDEPHLPGPPAVIGPLRRDSNGGIEIVDPTKSAGSAARRCEAGAICVGPGQSYATLSDAAHAARDGDLIEVIGGTYHDTAQIVASKVTVRGIEGRPHFDCAGIRPVADKACILLLGQFDTLDNIEISGAEVPANAGNNGACVRNGHDVSFTLRNVICHGSQNGVLSDGGTVVIEESEFFDNGWDDRTHNAYIGGNCPSVTVRGSTFRDARVGHEFKSRCAKTEISDSTFRSTKGSRDIDVPDGGDVMIYRSTIEKTAGAESEEIIGFAAESCRYPGDLVLKDVRILNRRSRADIHNFDKCENHAIVFDHVTVEGNKLLEVGNILHH
jgi:hypothetical protein